MRTLLFSAFIFLFAIFFSACQKPSNGPIIPYISFKSFTAIDSNSARLEINFTDGDGDIGYLTQDASPQPNLWIRYLYQDSATHNFIGMGNPNDVNTHDSVYFVYSIPNLTPNGKNKSLKGVIEVTISPLWYVPVYSPASKNVIEYQIWLYDRAGHQSNVITVGPFNGI